MSDDIELDALKREVEYLREIAALRADVAAMRAELDAKLVPDYRGVFKADTGTEYPRGSMVTCAGGCWIALSATTDKPGDGATAWRLMVKSAKNGRSAYDIWRSLGNVGTEKDFIASLRGPEGRPGPQGPSGRNATATFLPDSSADKLTEAMIKAVRGSRMQH